MKFYFGAGVTVLGLVTISVAYQLIERASEWRGPEGVLFGLGIFILGVLSCRNARKDLPKVQRARKERHAEVSTLRPHIPWRR